MKRFHCIVALAIGTSAAACSSAGDDVTVVPRTGQAQSSLTCAIAPGEDVCARSFDMLDPSARPTFVGFAASAAEFAGIARDGRDQIWDACGSIIQGLGLTRPALAPELSPNARVVALCDFAIAAIGAVNRSTFTISATAGTCSDAPPPACAASTASKRRRCAAPTTSWTLAEGATARDAFAAETLGKNVAFALEAKGRLEALARLAADVSGGADRLAGVTGPGSSACIQTVITLVSAANEDTTTMASLSSRLVEAIAPSP
jgi:hypothetical protein